jgi:hypothetical protein
MSSARASESGFPVSVDSASASSSIRASMSSAILSSTFDRSAARIAAHSGNARVAAPTAAAMSFSPLSGARANGRPVAGSSTSRYRPAVGETSSPSM